MEASRATVVEYNVELRVLADVHGLPMHITGLRYRGTGHGSPEVNWAIVGPMGILLSRATVGWERG